MATGSVSSAVIARLRRDASDPDDTEDPDTGQKEIFSSYALLILILLLIVAFFTSYILRSKKSRRYTRRSYQSSREWRSA